MLHIKIRYITLSNWFQTYGTNIDIDALARLAIVNSLIYGVRSVARQTEHALGDIVECVKDDRPEVFKLLKHGRYVDNLLELTTRG